MHRCFTLLARLFSVSVLVAALLACKMGGTLKAAGNIQEEVRNEFGVESNVNVNTRNGSTTVIIGLRTLPAAKLEIVKTRITSIAKKHIPDADHVVVNTNL